MAKSNTDAEKIVARWLPRLEDPSSEVQEQAAQKLSELAASSKAYRDDLLPPLLALARSTDRWPVACNSIMYPTAEIPKTDQRWLDAFVDLYVELATRDAYVTSENAYGYLAELMTEEKLTSSHPAFETIVAMARRDVTKREGDERKHIFTILDWVEDNP
jgi:hypothetical protein